MAGRTNEVKKNWKTDGRTENSSSCSSPGFAPFACYSCWLVQDDAFAKEVIAAAAAVRDDDDDAEDENGFACST